MSTTTISYDEEYDIFYYHCHPDVPSYADEDENGVITLRGITDNSIVGMVIYMFKSRLSRGEFENNRLPLPLDLNDPAIIRVLENSTDPHKEYQNFKH